MIQFTCHLPCQEQTADKAVQRKLICDPVTGIDDPQHQLSLRLVQLPNGQLFPDRSFEIGCFTFVQGMKTVCM